MHGGAMILAKGRGGGLLARANRWSPCLVVSKGCMVRDTGHQLCAYAGAEGIGDE